MAVFNFRIHKHGNKHTITIPADYMKSNCLQAGDQLTLLIRESQPYKIVIQALNDAELRIKYAKLKAILGGYYD